MEEFTAWRKASILGITINFFEFLFGKSELLRNEKIKEESQNSCHKYVPLGKAFFFSLEEVNIKIEM